MAILHAAVQPDSVTRMVANPTSGYAPLQRNTLALKLMSAGALASKHKPNWAALHRLMEYLEAHPSFKPTYCKRSALSDGLTGFAD